MIDAALYWTAALMLIGLVRWYGCGCPCECGIAPYIECSSCTGTGVNAPQFMTVEIAGIVNGTCSACATYNGTFVVPINLGAPCQWQLTLSDSSCNTSGTEWYVQVNVTFVSPNYFVKCYVRFNGGVSVFSWQNSNGTSKVACLELVDEDVAFVSVTDGRCGGTPTFTLTSGDAT